MRSKCGMATLWGLDLVSYVYDWAKSVCLPVLKTAAAAFAVPQMGQGTETLAVSFLAQADNIATSEEWPDYGLKKKIKILSHAGRLGEPVNPTQPTQKDEDSS